MKSPELTCDDQLLLAMLREELPREASEELLDHVESCSRCQQRISDLAASKADWQRATDLMMPDSSGPPHYEVPGLSQQAAQWSETIARQLLSPPSHPEMLGRLGRYEIERVIGSGGMGVVFKAFDGELNRPVAIKLLAPHLAGSGPARQRFSREARAAAAVMHRHVVPIHNVETDGELPYIVMQYVSGESLQDRIDHDGPLELCEVLRIGTQVADGLAAAHQQGLVHRDIKPSNILLEEDVERALITDFGLARAVDDASLTRTGFHPGTPQYMSPEQACGQSIDARSDLFSLGSTLYTMCTGRPPFRAESSLSVMRRISESEPPSLRELNPAIPEWMCAVIAHLMAKNPADRFQSAREVHELLEACLRHVQQPASTPLPKIPRVTPVAMPRQPAGMLSGRQLMNPRTLAAVAICLSLPVLIAVFRTEVAQPDLEGEALRKVQFRAAEAITNRDQKDLAFAALAMSAAQATDVLMTRRAIDHIVRTELRSPTQRDCAIELFRQGKRDEAYAVAESISHRVDRDAALLAFTQGDMPKNSTAAAAPPPVGAEAPPAVPPESPSRVSGEPSSVAEITPDDTAAIQGTWQVTYSEDSGRVSPQEALKELRFVFVESKLILQMGGKQTEATFQLDSTQTPKWIDITENERTKPGIYDLEGDTLRISFAEHTDDRPTAFDSKRDSMNDVIVLMKRIKPE